MVDVAKGDAVEANPPASDKADILRSCLRAQLMAGLKALASKVSKARMMRSYGARIPP
jgi:hypothetical protein